MLQKSYINMQEKIFDILYKWKRGKDGDNNETTAQSLMKTPINRETCSFIARALFVIYANNSDSKAAEGIV